MDNRRRRRARACVGSVIRRAAHASRSSTPSDAPSRRRSLRLVAWPRTPKGASGVRGIFTPRGQLCGASVCDRATAENANRGSQCEASVERPQRAQGRPSCSEHRRAAHERLTLRGIGQLPNVAITALLRDRCVAAATYDAPGDVPEGELITSTAGTWTAQEAPLPPSPSVCPRYSSRPGSASGKLARP